MTASSGASEATKAADTASSSDELFETLWTQFETETGFGRAQLEQERKKLRDELESLEARIEEKRAQLATMDRLETGARDQLLALIQAKLSPDAILSAMRVEYKPRRAATSRTKRSSAATPVTISDDDKKAVLDNLDAEGLTLGELRKRTGRDADILQGALKALLADGEITKTGERRSSRYHLP